MVEIHKERPVDMPCTRMQLGESGWFCGCEERGRRARVDYVPESVELFEGNVPFTREDIRGEFTPVCGSVKIVVCGKDAEVVEVVCGTAVISVCILELTKVVQSGNLFQCQLLVVVSTEETQGELKTHIVVIFEILQVLTFILTQGLSNIGVLDDIQYSLSLLLESFVCRYGIFTFSTKFCKRY
jgi:hypothetical protein